MVALGTSVTVRSECVELGFAANVRRFSSSRPIPSRRGDVSIGRSSTGGKSGVLEWAVNIDWLDRGVEFKEFGECDG